MKLASLIALVLFSAACDQDAALTDPPPQTREIDLAEPCAFLSPNQVERAVGTPVRDEREVDSHDLITRICSYTTTEPYASVGVVIDSPVTQEEFEKRMRRDPVNTKILDGVADMAFIHGCSSVDLLVGDVSASLGVQHLTTCEKTEIVLLALAKEAIAELQSSFNRGRSST
jgi:hypothetical protein